MATGIEAKAGRGTASSGKSRRAQHGDARGSALDTARAAGLIEGQATEHLSFRAPKALVDAAKRETGIASPTELGLLALAILAQPDPVVAFLRRTRGQLAGSPPLEY